LKLSNLKSRGHISLIVINVYFENFVFPVIKKNISVKIDFFKVMGNKCSKKLKFSR
jgi:hypothetical protein